MTVLRLLFTEADLPATTETVVSWFQFNGSRWQRGRSTIAALPAGDRLEVLLPPARVLRTEVTLPKGAARQVRKLLPHALDQMLLSDADTLHLAHQTEGESCRVAAVDKTLLAELLGTLASVGRRPQHVWAADALIGNDGSTLLWLGNGWARRRGALAEWFDADTPASPPALLASTPSDDPLTLYLDPDSPSRPAAEFWTTQLGRPVEIANADPMIAPAAPDAIDLLQGELAAGPQLDLDWSRLRPTGLLIVAALALLLLSWGSEWWRGRSEERALQAQMRDAFTRAFPGTPLIDPQLQLESMRKSPTPSNAANGTLGPLLELAALLRSAPYPLESLDYRGNTLEAVFRAKPEQLSELAQQLASRGQPGLRPEGADRTVITVTLKP
ncbi:type II secretion system protein GspL [Chitinimonas sp. BJYL2]|uniref:type II secretion system protein GspL n=1 Tax=Chitinimonas sp. BJYL2 TaxID=2976696 RepID=UPI0022B2AF75|nr:type II secretion system protein GspL [Chitinimonas sp. BJYL2]